LQDTAKPEKAFLYEVRLNLNILFHNTIVLSSYIKDSLLQTFWSFVLFSFVLEC